MNNALFSGANVRAIICALCVGAVFSVAAGDQWSRFRGPDGSGIAVAGEIPNQWTEKDFVWKVRLPGKGHSSPVIWNDRVFVTSGKAETADRFITCFDSGSGKRVWEKTYGSKIFKQHLDNSFATSTPAVDDSGIYCYWSTPDAISVLALSLDGQEKWVKNLGPFVSQHGSGTSLVIQDQVVWVNNDQDGGSALIGLDCNTGEVRYKIARRSDKVSYATPCVFRPAGKPAELIFAASSHGLTSINPKTGAINWEFTNLFPVRVVSSPIASEELVFCSCGEGGVGKRLVAVKPPSDGSPAKVLYDFKAGVPNVPTPLAVNGRLYIVADNGLVRCVRAATGEALWQEKLEEPFYSSPIYADGRLFVTSKEGTVFVLKAGDKFELLGKNSLGEPSFASPALADGRIFFRTFTQLIAIGAGIGKK